MRRFTVEDDQFLRDNYLTIPAKRMSKMLNRSESGARQRMVLLDLCVPKEVTDQFKKNSQIKPGNIPSNRGKKQVEYMSAESIERTVASRFKKGSTPKNTKYDGFERISKDGYIEIRVSKGKFRLKHRVEWEKENGPVSHGHVLIAKDSNKLNTAADNWLLITMAENMERNSGAIRLPDTMVATYLAVSGKKVDQSLKQQYLKMPELLSAKRNQLLLIRKIKSLQNGK